jgi:hypothetical protein
MFKIRKLAKSLPFSTDKSHFWRAFVWYTICYRCYLKPLHFPLWKTFLRTLYLVWIVQYYHLLNLDAFTNSMIRMYGKRTFDTYLWAMKFIDPYIVRCRQFKFRVKFFFVFVLHHLIERELLNTKIYFSALASAFIGSKNTKYCEGVVFREKHIFLEMCKILYFVCFSSFWE